MPTEPLVTRVRIIDSMFPIVRGGTYCIPGPFGAGKTVLQQITSRHAEVDIVIIAACGERAGEVVETLREFPELIDPRTGKSLMERTIIICNTSAMPVAAREASVYTAATLGEYYRQMGLNVLLLADSTSRWAQAMREVSGRLEEIPGEEAFPAYLESRIAGFYERAGAVELNDGAIGSLTIGGTVSPAGGNFEEPVTQGTLKVVGAFHGLSRARSDARRYPAIDPLDSWSKYRGIIDPEKVAKVARRAPPRQRGPADDDRRRRGRAPASRTSGRPQGRLLRQLLPPAERLRRGRRRDARRAPAVRLRQDPRACSTWTSSFTDKDEARKTMVAGLRSVPELELRRHGQRRVPRIPRHRSSSRPRSHRWSASQRSRRRSAGALEAAG